MNRRTRKTAAALFILLTLLVAMPYQQAGAKTTYLYEPVINEADTQAEGTAAAGESSQEPPGTHPPGKSDTSARERKTADRQGKKKEAGKDAKKAEKTDSLQEDSLDTLQLEQQEQAAETEENYLADIRCILFILMICGGLIAGMCLFTAFAKGAK